MERAREGWMLQPVRGRRRTWSETKRTGGCWGRAKGILGSRASGVQGHGSSDPSTLITRDFLLRPPVLSQGSERPGLSR